jgi:hypothetical protein
MKVEKSKIHIVLDLGPSTMVMLAEVLLILLKILNYLTVSWVIILSPIIAISAVTSIIILMTFFKTIKNHFF